MISNKRNWMLLYLVSPGWIDYQVYITIYLDLTSLETLALLSRFDQILEVIISLLLFFVFFIFIVFLFLTCSWIKKNQNIMD